MHGCTFPPKRKKEVKEQIELIRMEVNKGDHFKKARFASNIFFSPVKFQDRRQKSFKNWYKIMPIWEVHWKIVRTFEATPLGKYFWSERRTRFSTKWVVLDKEREENGTRWTEGNLMECSIQKPSKVRITLSKQISYKWRRF